MVSLTSAPVDCSQAVTAHSTEEVFISSFIAEYAHFQAKVTFLYVKTKVELHNL